MSVDKKTRVSQNCGCLVLIFLFVGLPIGALLRLKLNFEKTVAAFPLRATEVTSVIEAVKAYHEEHGRWPKDLDCLCPKYIEEPIPPDWVYTNSDEPVLQLNGPYHLMLTYRFPIGPEDDLSGWRCSQEGSEVPMDGSR